MKTYIQISVLLILALLSVSYRSQAADKSVSSITVSQVDTFALMEMPDQPVLKIHLKIAGTTGSLELQKLRIGTLNEDNSDVDSVLVYFTRYDRFSLVDYPGEAVRIGTGKKIVGDSVVLNNIALELESGDYYLWVVMNLSKYSKASHYLDACLPANGIMINNLLYPAALQSPANNVLIHSIYFLENFENYSQGSEPGGGWYQEQFHSSRKWICNYGGYKLEGSASGHPEAPKSGNLNVMLQKLSDISDTTILVSPPLDLLLATKPTLTFYHAQVGMCKDAYCQRIDNDQLVVLYKIGSEGTWTELDKGTFQLAAPVWLKREIILPSDACTNNVYLGFKGITKNGWGVCLDSLVIYENDIITKNVNSIIVRQPVKDIVPQGTINNPIMRVNVRIKGNTGTIKLNAVKFTSTNTSDNDITTNGAKLYYTNDSVFMTPVQLGTSQTFSGGAVTFASLDKNLETGNNYLWLTYDTKPGATPGNVLDAVIKSGDINLSVAGIYPSKDESPDSSRLIKQTIFSDDFDGSSLWTLKGLFQIGVPKGMGGTTIGMPDPQVAYSGSNVLGTALSPTGDYEPYLKDESSWYTATSALIDGRYFKNLQFDFYRWLNVDNTDTAAIEYKLENENTWKEIWVNKIKFVESKWTKQSYKNEVKPLERKKFYIRFRLGPTDGTDNYSGWNIDNIFICGDSIPMDAAVGNITYPKNSCDLSSSEHVKFYLKNTGPKPLINTPVKLSINGGKNYITETVPGPVLPGDSLLYTFMASSDFSKPAMYSLIIKTAHPKDNYSFNDSVEYNVSSLPTYTVPYGSSFEKDTTFWFAQGRNSSWNQDRPFGAKIDYAILGQKCWKTDQGGYHNPYEYSYVESPCFSFSGKALPMVDLKYSTDILNRTDGAILEYSVDQGANWSYVPTDSYPFVWNWYNDTVFTLKHKGWTGETTESGYQVWKQGRQVLPSAVANQNKVRFRIVFKSDSAASTRREGFAFDDFKLYDAPFDIGVSAINGINNPACQYENSPYLNVTVKNFGYQQMKTGDTIVIGAMVNGALQAVDTLRLTGNLVKDATLAYTMKKRVHFEAPGDYKLKVFTMIEKDKDFYGTNNDTTSVTFTVRPNPVTGLRKTYATSRLDTLKLKPLFDSNYSYKWSYKGVDSLIQVKTAKDTGKYVLEVTNTTTLCKTKDTISVLPLKLDIGVSQILSPVTNCGYTATYKPVIRITNFGTDTLAKNKSVPLKITLNGNPVITDNIVLSKALAPDSSYVTPVNWSSDFLSAGSYQLMIRTDLSPYDSQAANDSAKNIFTIYSYPAIELGPDVYVKALSHTIKLTQGYPVYAWSDGSDKDSLKITTSGKYKVSVTNSNGCVTKDSIIVKLAIHDLKVKRIISPQNSCATPGMSMITCKLMNNGTDTIKTNESIAMKYSLNGGTIYSQSLTLSSALLPGDSVTFAFTQQQDLSQPNTYRFKISASVANDLVIDNDTLRPVIKVFANPKIDLGKDDDKLMYKYQIYPGSGYKHYLWQDGSTDTAYMITQTHFDPMGTYSVTVTDDNGCTDQDTVVIHLLVDDIQLRSIRFPETSCQKYGKDTIFIKVVNTGNRKITNKDIDISYQVNDSTRIGEVFKFTGNPNDSMVYKLSRPVKLWKTGMNKLFATVSMSGDVRRDNDTLTHFTDVLYGAIIDFGAINDTLVVDLPHTLDAGTGTNFTYQWSTGATTQTIQAATESEYKVTVTSNECINTKRVVVLDKYYDLSVSAVTMPASACIDGKKKGFGLEITNTGKMTLSNEPVIIRYKVNGSNEKQQNVTFTGKPGIKASYNFTDSADITTAGDYTFLGSLEYAQDENAANNEKAGTISMVTPPVINFNATEDTIKVTSLPYTIDAGTGTNYTYKWQDNSAQQTYAAPARGRYTVTVSNTACSSSKSVVIWDVTPVRVITDKAKVKIYPNPAHEYLRVELSLQDNKEVVLELVSSTGKVIHTRQLTGSKEYTESVDVSNLPRGLYYIRVYQRGWIVTEKVVLN